MVRSLKTTVALEWIEFRPIIKQPPEEPIPISEFTAHFQKKTGTVCMLGLPTADYESLNCQDDEAPDSQ